MDLYLPTYIKNESASTINLRLDFHLTNSAGHMAVRAHLGGIDRTANLFNCDSPFRLSQVNCHYSCTTVPSSNAQNVTRNAEVMSKLSTMQEVILRQSDSECFLGSFVTQVLSRPVSVGLMLSMVIEHQAITRNQVQIADLLSSRSPKPIHNRMPVIVAPGGYDRWLAPAGPTRLPIDLLKLLPAERMRMWPIRKHIGNLQKDGVELIQPLT